jgi:predicted AAA+ superfamily ATPase
VDERRKAGDFVLTGSPNLLLLGRVADTLAGRAIYLELAPFCPAEWLQRKEALEPIDRLFSPDFVLDDWPAEKGSWQRWLLCGGFPPALALEADRDRGLWFAAYVQTYLERDLRQLSDVASLPDFQRLVALAANRTGKLLNQADLARDAALSHPTAHRYLNLLETGCMITRIRPFTTNPSSAMVKAPKLLWSDCGLECLRQLRQHLFGRGEAGPGQFLLDDRPEHRDIEVAELAMAVESGTRSMLWRECGFCPNMVQRKPEPLPWQ